VADLTCAPGNTCTNAFTVSDLNTGDTLTTTYTITGGGGNGATWTSEAGGTFSFSPVDATDAGVYTVTITTVDDNSIGDGTNGILTTATTFTLTVSELNVAPVVTAADQTCVAAAVCSYTPTYTDSNAGDTHVVSALISAAALPAWIDLTAGVFTFSPPDNTYVNTYTIDLSVLDDNSVADVAGALTGIDSFVLTITAMNEAPVLTTTDLSCYAGSTCTSIVTYTDANVGDAHTITYTVSGGSGNGATWTSEATDTFTFVPTDNGEVGTYTISVTVTDDDTAGSGATLSDTQTITLTVLEGNIAPVVTVAS
jgi:hypothetical protein